MQRKAAEVAEEIHGHDSWIGFEAPPGHHACSGNTLARKAALGNAQRVRQRSIEGHAAIGWKQKGLWM